MQHFVAVSGLLVLFGSTASASAQTTAEASNPGQRLQVEDPLRRGQRARDLGRWGDAEAAFRAALDAPDAASLAPAKRAEITGELGLAELALEKPRSAAEHLAESLSQRASLSPVLQRRFEEGQRKAEKRVMRLYLGVDPPDADVLLDGRPLGRQATTHQLFLDPGQHTVRARLAGYGDFVDTFEASAGEQRTLAVRLPRLPPAPAASAAPLPARVAPPAAGNTPSSTGTKLRTAGVILTATTAVVGATALVWGAVLDGGISERGDRLRGEGWDVDACARPDRPVRACSELRDSVARREALSTIGIVSMAASGMAGVATFASFVLAGGEPRGDAGVRVAPLAGEGQPAGLMLHGVW